MKTFDVPQWITELLLANGVTDDSYHLYGAGRALGFVRMASHALDEGIDFKEAEYHTYSGISASRTAIDAIASWLNNKLKLGFLPSPKINLSRKGFRTKVLYQCSTIKQELLSLGNLGETIDEHRQRAQHREGLAIRCRLNPDDGSNQFSWYLAPKGLSGSWENDLLLTALLGHWADHIEADLQKIQESLE